MAEREGTFFYERALAPPTVDQIIKMMIVYELHGLSDVAVDTAVKFFKELKKRFDGGAVGVAQPGALLSSPARSMRWNSLSFLMPSSPVSTAIKLILDNSFGTDSTNLFSMVTVRPRPRRTSVPGGHHP